MASTNFVTGTIIPVDWLNDVNTLVYTPSLGAGKLFRSNGTVFTPSTFTIPNTFAIGDVLFASATNVLSAIAKVNNGVFTTSATGVPQWLASVANRVLATDGSGVPTWTAPTGTGAPVLANSPVLSGTPTAPTPTVGDTSTRLATTAYADASSAAQWTTGDVKLTLKTVADVGWVLMNDLTIGDAASGATGRSNADTQALFTLLWNNTSDADCPVSGGRTGSAANDYASHKSIALPKALGRALATYGTGTGLTTRTLAKAFGEETHTLLQSELPPVVGTLKRNLTPTAGGDTSGIATNSFDGNNNGPVNIVNNGGGNGHNVIQPTLFLNTMIKL